MNKTILVVGTFDTKDDELNFVCDIIRAQGGTPMSMDVSVLGDPKQPPLRLVRRSRMPSTLATRTSPCRSWPPALRP